MYHLKLKVNKEIKSASEWSNANRLLLNISKFNIILINAKEHDKNYNNSSDNLVKFSSHLSIVKTSKYLGVAFDDALSFQYHIQNFKKKLSPFSWDFSKSKTIFKCERVTKLIICNLSFPFTL